jgi:Methyltransferase domain
LPGSVSNQLVNEGLARLAPPEPRRSERETVLVSELDGAREAAGAFLADVYVCAMVNVHIHEFVPGGGVLDANAMEQFQKQWGAYEKLVLSDVLSHQAAGAILHQALLGVATSFGFLDIACGDASLAKQALAGTRVSHYHGIDLSDPAIRLAAKMLDGVPYPVDLDHQDFVSALKERPEPADIAWCGLSIHHLVTAEKLELMRAIRGATRIAFVLYEPCRRDGEDRNGWRRRFLAAQVPTWTTLAAEEKNQLVHHIETSDLPETASDWMDLGLQAGFAQATQRFVDPTDGLRMFRYDV